MKITYGYDFFDLKNGRKTPVEADFYKIINGHIFIVGASGVGKSYNLMKMVNQASASSPDTRFYIMDAHGDLEFDNCSTMLFSEQSPYGLNPLTINPDPDFGGVRRSIQSFILTIRQAFGVLGINQEAALRNILLDVFRDFGFLPEDPSTWAINEFDVRSVGRGSDNRIYLQVPIEEKDKAKAYGARWDPDKKCWYAFSEDYRGELTNWKPAFKKRTYPTLRDVVEYCESLYTERFLGSDQKAMRALLALNKSANSYQKKLIEHAKYNRIKGSSFDEEAELALASAREKAIEAFANYANSIQTGFELDSLMKYDSADTIKGVLTRVRGLESTGVFKDVPAPFDPSKPVWRYKLDALINREEKKMMVLFLLQDLFNKAVQKGKTTKIRDVIILDELSTYTSSQDENGDGIIGIIAREARKYGLALWAADQTPEVPVGLLSSVGTKIILGLDEMFWNSAVSKLRVESNQLAWISPKHTAAIQMKESGSTKIKWRWVQL